MTTPTQTQPPFIPLRRSGWATRRTPLWVFVFLAVKLLVIIPINILGIAGVAAHTYTWRVDNR